MLAARNGERYDNQGSKVVLDLEYTELTRLPDAVGALNLVHEMWLGGNGLPSLPSSISGMHSLRLLDVRCSRPIRAQACAHKRSQTRTYPRTGAPTHERAQTRARAPTSVRPGVCYVGLSWLIG